MAQQPDDQSDFEAIDRTFAEMVAGLQLHTDPAQLPSSPDSPTVSDPGLAEPADSTNNTDDQTDDPDHRPASAGQPDPRSADTDELLAELERQFDHRVDRTDRPPDHQQASWPWEEQTPGHPAGSEGDRGRHGDADASWRARRSSRGHEATADQRPTIWRGGELGSASPEPPDSWDADDDDADPDEGKPVPPPWPHLPAPVVLGWLGIFLAIGTVAVAAAGIDLPRWAGWAAIAAFAGGFGLLLSRLPRDRPPDSSNGARL